MTTFEHIINSLLENDENSAKKALNEFIMKELINEAGANIGAVKNFLVKDKHKIKQFFDQPEIIEMVINEPEKCKDAFVNWISTLTGVSAGLITRRKDIINRVNDIITNYNKDPDIHSAYTKITNNNPLNGRPGQTSTDPEADVNPYGSVTQLDRERFYQGQETNDEETPGYLDDENYNDDDEISGMDSTDMLRSQNRGVAVSNKNTRGFRQQGYADKHRAR